MDDEKVNWEILRNKNPEINWDLLQELFEHPDNATILIQVTEEGPYVHKTTSCTSSDCTIKTPHGHDCPKCGPGIYGIPLPTN